jgi:hypothetical protein
MIRGCSINTGHRASQARHMQQLHKSWALIAPPRTPASADAQAALSSDTSSLSAAAWRRNNTRAQEVAQFNSVCNR